tara:strand:- start:1377 stop:1712 length:336 start_codon:yes stop_codon:yes gene_type:complete
MDTREKIERVGAEIIGLLISKNADYGDSATNPINVFSDGDAVNSLCARIDDKLSRIKQKGIYDKTEDTVKDLTGYLVLLLIALKDQQEPGNNKKSNSKPFRDHSGWFSNHT